MKHATLILATFIGFLAYPLLSHSDSAPSVGTLFVFKLDGTKHGEPYAGVSLDSMALELEGAGIEVFSSKKGYDGREGIAICGAPTGQINIYEILSSNLASALSMGFTQLPENWIRQDPGEGTRPNTSPHSDAGRRRTLQPMGHLYNSHSPVDCGIVLQNLIDGSLV